MNDINKVDIVFGLVLGDEAKAKVVNNLASNYDFVCRWNGGPNAGHTIYHNGNKIVLHLIPCGVVNNKFSIIGPNCVLNPDKFFDELDYLKSMGYNINLIKVSPKTAIITKEHIKYDLEVFKPKLGTTGQGIGPCYADKALRTGILAKDVLPPEFIWDEKLYGNVLCEGAQSYWLDINKGEYPYVTSAETLPYNACSLGFPPNKISNIFGVAKMYDTKSGIDPLFPQSLLDDPELAKLGELGEEYGATTGRRRICNWLNLDRLKEAISISGANITVINKCDIIEKLGIFKVINNGKIEQFSSLEEMKEMIFQNLISRTSVIFSGSKEFI